MKTTKWHTEFFIKRVHYWQELLSLMDWRIDMFTQDLGETVDAAAKVNFEGKCASITLNSKIGGKWTKKLLDKCAFHEVCEILLSQLAGYAKTMTSDTEVNERVHDIIRTLENVVCPRIRGKL